MSKIAIFKKLLFVSIITLFGVVSNVNAQSLSGSGTAESPYVISSTADWNTFANEANAATYWAIGVYIKLSNTWDNSSDEVSTMVGTSTNKFRGNFDGNGRTLTFTKLYSGEEANPIAPFLYVDGATISNLTVDGEISTLVDDAAGLIGYNTGSTTVQNVKVSAIINAENRQNCGGFAIDGKGVSFTSCVFNGTIQTSGHSGGFCGKGASSTNFTNCIFIPVTGSFISGGEGANFAYGGIGTVTNSYYTKKIGGSTQGKLATTSMEDNKIYLKITVLGITVYNNIKVDMTGYADNYVYTGSEITKPTITLQGLTLDTDYTVQYKFNNSAVENILDAGPYTLTIAGVNENNYYGSVVKNFVVGLAGSGSDDKPYTIANVNDWSTFAKTVENGYTYSEKTVKLTTDVGTADSPITTMIGVWSSTEGNRKPFSGTFNGDNHVLTISLSNSTAGNYVAPFVCTSGATIKQVTVEGNINTSVGYAAGLVGGTYGSVSKVQNNVTVSVDITNGSNGSAGNYCAGVAVDGTYVEISSCVYKGKIKAGTNSAGFVAIGSSDNTKVNSCLFAPAEESSITNGQNLSNGYKYLSKNYYTYKVGSSTQGSRAYSSYESVPGSGFWMKKQLYDNNDYFVSGTGSITGLHSPYYQHSAQSGGIIFTVTFKESDINAVDVDPSYYTVTYLNGTTPVHISKIGTGDFTLKITGNEGYCKGTLTAPIHIDPSIALSGTGTEDDPYQIASNTDWNTFANAVNAGHTFYGEFLELKNKITLTINNTVSSDIIAGDVVNDGGGAANKWFSGTFDGGWKTIEFNVGTSEALYAHTDAQRFFPSAPFRAIDGATIKNLTVEGKIYTDNKYNSGLVGFAYNKNTNNDNNIINCTSSIIVDCSKITNSSTITPPANNPDCSSAGFVAENKNGRINFTNCIFNGTLDKKTLTNAQKCAGFVSYNNGTVSFTNCTMAGKITINKEKGTYFRKNTANFSNAYYVNDYGGVTNCKPALTSEPTDGIARKYKNEDDAWRYVPGAIITGLGTTTYTYIEGESITIDAPTVKYYGKTLTRGTDYQIKLDDVLVEGAITIKTAGIHPLKIEGIGDNYCGSYTVNIKYVNFNSWAIVQATMADASSGDRVITLNDDIRPATNTDRYLEVKGNVVLNLNGKTIDRNLTEAIVYGQVIRVESGANLTINGPGTITGGFHYPGSNPPPENPNIFNDPNTYYDKRDGGGIHNMGSLTLNNVTVERNKCIKESEGSESYTARGGGIYSGSGSSLVINGGYIEYNEARGGGGGVYSEGANPFTMDGVNVNYNYSESKGGGVRVKTTGSNVAELTNCTLCLNLATAVQGEGGGVYMEAGELHMTNCELLGNQSRYRGCGFYSVRGTTVATNCNISYNGSFANEDTNFGGGVCLGNSGNSTFIMDGGTMEVNNSNANGGGIYVYNGSEFQVKGKVIIRDNHKGSAATGAVDNNTYLYGTAVMKVVGDITGSEITITPSSSGAKTYVTFGEGVSGAEALACFKIDSDDHDIIIDESGNIEVYEPYPWNKTTTWKDAIAENSNGDETIPDDGSDLEIHRSIRIPSGYVAKAKSISTDAYCNIIIEDGGQLLNDSEDVNVLAKKNIVAASDTKGAGGWYIISSPVANPSITDNTNLITEKSDSPTYDLYRFNEAATLQWENYRAEHEDFTTLQNGRGYLYRNANDYKIEISGKNNNSNVSYTLSCAASNELKGFNLIGNPYSHTIYKGVDTEDVHPAIPNGTLLEGKYYVLDPTTGEWNVTEDGTAIAPLTGILVQAKDAGTLTMTNSTKGEVVPESKSDRANLANRKNLWFTVANSTYEDRACVEFKEGHGLNKIQHENENAPMLYIRHDGEDFASVDMNPETKMFDLNFEAKTFGHYTLSVKTQGSYRYLHLIDKVVEREIDLLEEQEYKFIGSTSDVANRFIVRLSLAEDPEESDDEVFAYQSGNDIVVEGEGELQVFDVMGRMVASQHVSGVQTIEKPSQTGVYIFRLEGKAQKMVVR